MTLQELLTLPQATLIGSRALGVANHNSDYDIVIPLSSIPTMLQERLDSGGDFSIERYFSKIPSLGRGWFFDYVFVSSTKVNVQVIVLENELDLEHLQYAMEDLQKLPKYMLVEKHIRIALFESALMHYGWITPIKDPLTNIPY